MIALGQPYGEVSLIQWACVVRDYLERQTYVVKFELAKLLSEKLFPPNPLFTLQPVPAG